MTCSVTRVLNAAQATPYSNLRKVSRNVAKEDDSCCLAPGLFDAVAVLLNATQVNQPLHMLYTLAHIARLFSLCIGFCMGMLCWDQPCDFMLRWAQMHWLP